VETGGVASAASSSVTGCRKIDIAKTVKDIFGFVVYRFPPRQYVDTILYYVAPLSRGVAFLAIRDNTLEGHPSMALRAGSDCPPRPS
jgi:hypothetical protein